MCGNNVLDTSRGEVCDDGNTASGDGCSNLCQREVCGDHVQQSRLAAPAAPDQRRKLRRLGGVVHPARDIGAQREDQRAARASIEAVHGVHPLARDRPRDAQRRQ